MFMVLPPLAAKRRTTASAIGSAADVLGAFSDELMGGRYPDGRFYRPLVHLSFGLDHAIGGLEPSQYSRTDISILAATATLGCYGVV